MVIYPEHLPNNPQLPVIKIILSNPVSGSKVKPTPEIVELNQKSFIAPDQFGKLEFSFINQEKKLRLV